MQGSTIAVRVAGKQVEAVDICSFELVSSDGSLLPSFSAGSHVDVHLPGDITRQYSLCNDPAEVHRYLIAVLKDPATRGRSRSMHTHVSEGDILEISSPKNHFTLAHAAKRSLLLAGGIGITPILCMAERLHVSGAEFELHYCARSVERMAFRDRIQRSDFAQRASLHFDNGPEEQKLSIESLLARRPRDGTHVYVCGPQGFMDAVLSAARRHGWPEAQLHYEFFGASVRSAGTDGQFHVILASSGRSILVGKEQTVVRALTEAGVHVQTSCEQGICGTCLTRVLEGVPDHRDLFLTPDEQAANAQFLPCCSRAKTATLILDL